jgi:hypothetical protein
VDAAVRLFYKTHKPFFRSCIRNLEIPTRPARSALPELASINIMMEFCVEGIDRCQLVGLEIFYGAGGVSRHRVAGSMPIVRP